MRVLLTGSSLQCCDMVKAILESRGIACMLKNEYSSMESGSTFARPELWVVDDAQFEEARAILREHEAAHITAEDSIELLPASAEDAGSTETTHRRSLRFKVVVALGLAAIVAGVLWVGTSLRRASAETYGAQGYAYQQKDDHQHAIQAYSEAIRLSPSYWQAYYNRGLSKDKKGNFDGAIADFSRAIELNPKGADVYYSRGYAKHGKNDLDGAIADYTRAIELDPKMVPAYGSRGCAKGQKGDPDGAIADCNHAIELDPKNFSAYVNRGRAKYAKGELEEAIADLSRAIELDPKDAVVHYTRGAVKHSKDDLDGAIADYDHSIELDPKHVYAHLGRGSAKLEQADMNGAIADYNRANELAPKDAFVPVGLGALAHVQGRYEDAAVEYQKGLQLDPKNSSAHLGLGAVAHAQGRDKDAVAEYEKALALNPKDVFNRSETHINIAWSSLQQNDLVRAEQELSEAARLGVERFADTIAFTLGIVRARQGNADEAFVLWKKALSLCKGTSLTKRIDRAIYRIAAGQGKEGLVEMQKILAKTKLPADFIRSTLEGLEMLKRCPVKIEGLQTVIDLLNETKKTAP